MPRDKTKSHERIIEAAKKEFLEYGYADASLRRIAANAGIQVGGLYKHFASKEEMFDALVEPAIQDFYGLYHDIENEYFGDIKEVSEWEPKSEVTRAMELIYGRYEEFSLLILRSRGTRYEDFKHEIAQLEENATLRYLNEIKEHGCTVNEIDRTEFHLLTTSYVEAFFQPLIHGLDREKAMHYAGTLEDFYRPAWKNFLGI
ncbi:MAG: TetR/AcrR family transcriptional regulator [Ruminiclostridium sp.]|nr:TetR/AcrR family transcriptional regulator [Ruminiclostridium sp.]